MTASSEGAEEAVDELPHELPLSQAGCPPLSSVTDLAIALLPVGRAENPRQMHVGIYGPDVEDAPTLVHQPWDHHPLFERDTESLDCYAWLPALRVESDIVRRQFLDHCMALVESNPEGVPYGVCYAEKDHFDPNSKEFSDLSSAAGLTCATFVLELFRTYGIHLVDRQSWVERAGDKQWASQMFGHLEKTGGRQIAERVLAQVKDFQLKPMRFRPEEVAVAGALYAGTPLAMKDVEGHGQQVVDRICGAKLV